MDNEEFDLYAFMTRYWLWILLMSGLTIFGGHWAYLQLQPSFQKQEYQNKQMNPSEQEALRASIGRVKDLRSKITVASLKLDTTTDAQKKVEITNQIADWNSAIASLEVTIDAQIATAKSANVVLPTDITDYKQLNSAQ